MLRGDCSIRTEGYGFTPEEIAACAKRQGLLAIELELPGPPTCDCLSCRTNAAQASLSIDELRHVIDQAKALGCRRIILIDNKSSSLHLKQAIEHSRSEGLDVELFTTQSNLDSQFLSEHVVSVSLELENLTDLSRLESFKTSLRAI